MPSVIEEFLDKVCSEVKHKRAHESIRCELRSHIYDIMDNFLDKGMNEEEAAIEAISRMGNAVDIGKGLHKTNKPKVEWFLIILMSLIVLISIVGLSTLANDPAFYNMDLNRFLKAYSLYFILGIAIFLGSFLFDYRKFERYSWHLYIATVFLLLLSLASHRTINGISNIMIGGFTFTPVSYILFSFLVSFSGFVTKWVKGDMKGMLKLISLAMVAICLCLLQPSFGKAVLLGSGFLVLVIQAILSDEFQGNKKAFLVSIFGACILSIAIFYFTASDYQLARLNVFSYRNDPMGSGYLYYRAQQIFTGAKLFGKGEGL